MLLGRLAWLLGRGFSLCRCETGPGELLLAVGGGVLLGRHEAKVAILDQGRSAASPPSGVLRKAVPMLCT